VAVNLILIGKGYPRLLSGGLVVVDYPLNCWSAVFNYDTCGGTYPELISLPFQCHLRMLRAT